MLPHICKMFTTEHSSSPKSFFLRTNHECHLPLQCESSFLPRCSHPPQVATEMSSPTHSMALGLTGLQESFKPTLGLPVLPFHFLLMAGKEFQPQVYH